MLSTRRFAKQAKNVIRLVTRKRDGYSEIVLRKRTIIMGEKVHNNIIPTSIVKQLRDVLVFN